MTKDEGRHGDQRESDEDQLHDGLDSLLQRNHAARPACQADHGALPVGDVHGIDPVAEKLSFTAHGADRCSARRTELRRRDELALLDARLQLAQRLRLAEPVGGRDMQRLRRRAEFLKAATGVKASAAPFVLQAVRRVEDTSPRVGFTVSKKVGTAVERTRVRRRLREIVRRSAAIMRPGYDYVLIGRRAALHEPFDRMVAAFDATLRRVHAAASRPERS